MVYYAKRDAIPLPVSHLSSVILLQIWEKLLYRANLLATVNAN